MPTLQVMNRKHSNLLLNLNQTLMRRMRLEAIGDLRISWLEENISWKRRKKPMMMTMMNMTRNKNKRLSKNMPPEKERKRNKNSTWQKIIKRRKFKSSPSRKPKLKSRISSTHSINSPQRTNARSIWTTWMKSSNSQKIIKILRSFHSCLWTFPSELKCLDKWNWPISEESNGVLFTVTSTLFITSWRNLKRMTC